MDRSHKQLRDYLAWAQAQSPPYQMVLWARRTTEFRWGRSDLLAEIEAGNIIIKYLP